MSLTAGNLFISSYNNGDNDSSTDFGITLAVPVTKAKFLRLLGATLANLMMPFSTNDRLWVFSVNSVSFTMSFATDIRWATINDFIVYVNTVLFPGASPSAVPATLAYDQNRNQLYLTANTPGQVIIVPKWNWNNTFGTAVSYNANYRLGWTNTVDKSGVTTLYAEGFPNVFLRTNTIYITSNISADSNNDANVANIMGRIPVNVGWGGVIIYENVHSDFKIPVFCENIKDIRIKLLDEDYQPIINPSNAYFNIVIGIEY
jgi:hypothetical protein